MSGGDRLRSIPELEMVWVEEIEFFTPYTQGLIRERMRARESNQEESGLEDRDVSRMLALKAMYEAGGGHLILVGTDTPTSGPRLPGFAYHRELTALVHAGLPPVAALKAATINGARALGVESQLGTIEPGKLADLYIVQGNPLEDIKASRDVRYVLKNGEVYDPEALMAAAEGKIGPSGPDDHDYWKLQIEPLVPVF
jgi:imidazolonepropionase-like amidohydrolase